jgi:hypothetical protein
MMAEKGAVKQKHSRPPDTAAHDFIQRLTTPKASKVGLILHKAPEHHTAGDFGATM